MLCKFFGHPEEAAREDPPGRLLAFRLRMT
jgi:hypothetical protein